MDDLLEKWKKEMDEKLKEFDNKVEIPPTKSRCPKCMKPTLEFDADKGCFRCTNCGFEYCVKKVMSN
jgi:transposase